MTDKPTTTSTRSSDDADATGTDPFAPRPATPLRQRMIEDMVSRRLSKGTQIGHIRACKRFAAWLKRSPDKATVDEVRLFQLHLTETGTSIQTRNRTMTGLHHIKEPVSCRSVSAPTKPDACLPSPTICRPACCFRSGMARVCASVRRSSR